MSSVTLEEAQARLSRTAGWSPPGRRNHDHVTMASRYGKVKKAQRTSWPCKAGKLPPEKIRLAPDFDAALEDFKEYME